MRTGFAHLPLHRGKTPKWLFSRMVRLAREVICHIIEEYGSDEVLNRLSDPYWFQAFGCVLGFDWHSSGVTTTTCGAVKEGVKGLEHELGFYVAGGKGGASRKTPSEIEAHCNRLSREPGLLVNASKISAKVDSAAVQDGYQLYHHNFFFTNDKWCVVQQGFNENNKTARRYHWLSDQVRDFVNEPHSAVCSDLKGCSLNLVDSQSESTRVAVTEIASQPDKGILRDMDILPNLLMPNRHGITIGDVNSKYLKKIMLRTYEESPENFEELLKIKGVGPKTLRALTLLSELIFGTTASTRDPARFSFAHGGKDGTPYPVDIDTYERSISILNDALRRSKIERSEKLNALKRLNSFTKLL